MRESKENIELSQMRRLGMSVVISASIGISSILANCLYPSALSTLYARYSSGIFLFLASTGHFNPQFTPILRALLPDFLNEELKTAMIMTSGITELLSSLLIMLPGFTDWGVLLSVTTLLGVFPANINAAFSAKSRKKLHLSFFSALIRLPIQFVFIYWIYQARDTPDLFTQFMKAQ